MNIENLTIGEARQIAAIFTASQAGPQPATSHPFVGRYVIARCYAAGVHAGVVELVDGDNVILRDSRRLWAWKAANGVALSGVAQNGIDRSKCKIDTLNPLIYLTGVCELIPTDDKVREQINAA